MLVWCSRSMSNNQKMELSVILTAELLKIVVSSEDRTKHKTYLLCSIWKVQIHGRKNHQYPPRSDYWSCQNDTRLNNLKAFSFIFKKILSFFFFSHKCEGEDFIVQPHHSPLDTTINSEDSLPVLLFLGYCYIAAA